jgi:hypothetical protein
MLLYNNVSNILCENLNKIEMNLIHVGYLKTLFKIMQWVFLLLISYAKELEMNMKMTYLKTSCGFD